MTILALNKLTEFGEFVKAERPLDYDRCHKLHNLLLSEVVKIPYDQLRAAGCSSSLIAHTYKVWAIFAATKVKHTEHCDPVDHEWSAEAYKNFRERVYWLRRGH